MCSRKEVWAESLSMTAKQTFIFSKMQAEAGQNLEEIIARKEAERVAWNGVFWWGIGNSLGSSVHDEVTAAGGILPVLFSRMLSKPKIEDSAPDEVVIWTAWENSCGTVEPVPKFVRITSRTGLRKEEALRFSVSLGRSSGTYATRVI